MPQRTAAHRGRYKAKSKPTTIMPLLLRRALARRPPKDWPDVGQGISTHYPFPMWVQMLGANHLKDGAARADLVAMLVRLDRAEIGAA